MLWRRRRMLRLSLWFRMNLRRRSGRADNGTLLLRSLGGGAICGWRARGRRLRTGLRFGMNLGLRRGPVDLASLLLRRSRCRSRLLSPRRWRRCVLALEARRRLRRNSVLRLYPGLGRATNRRLRRHRSFLRLLELLLRRTRALARWRRRACLHALGIANRCRRRLLGRPSVGSCQRAGSNKRSRMRLTSLSKLPAIAGSLMCVLNLCRHRGGSRIAGHSHFLRRRTGT